MNTLGRAKPGDTIFLTTVDTINLGRRDRLITLARETADSELAGKRVAVLGVALKPNSDDIRDYSSLDACDRLATEGAIVSVHGPVAMPNAPVHAAAGGG